MSISTNLHLGRGSYRVRCFRGSAGHHWIELRFGGEAGSESYPNGLAIHFQSNGEMCEFCHEVVTKVSCPEEGTV